MMKPEIYVICQGYFDFRTKMMKWIQFSPTLYIPNYVNCELCAYEIARRTVCYRTEVNLS